VDSEGNAAEWICVGGVAALAERSLVTATVAGTALVLWRTAAGTVHAWEDRCPHRGARLSDGRVRDDRLVCGKHGWRFDADGCRAEEPEAPRVERGGTPCVRVYVTRIDGDRVWVRAEPARR
jgi:phenylpropionate dioxygenase-like ring-hydroxylating dioxygenase large terminal subunit